MVSTMRQPPKAVAGPLAVPKKFILADIFLVTLNAFTCLRTGEASTCTDKELKLLGSMFNNLMVLYHTWISFPVDFVK
jgi:hypothetical protein